MKKNSFLKAYRVFRDKKYGYQKLEIEIIPEIRNEEYIWLGNNIITLSYQGDSILLKDENQKWYGHSFKVDTYDTNFFKTINKMIDFLGGLKELQPKEAIEFLNNKKYRELQYHNGLSTLKFIDKWPEGNVYSAIYTRDDGTDGNITYICAKDELNAKVQFSMLMGESLKNHGYCTDSWKKWMIEGERIKYICEESKPIITELDLFPEEKENE